MTTQEFNGFAVNGISSYVAKVSMSTQAAFYHYVIVGTDNPFTDYHHPAGDIKIFYKNTAPFNNDGSVNTDRSIIIVDQWTGKCLRVSLPFVTDADIQKIKTEHHYP